MYNVVYKYYIVCYLILHKMKGGKEKKLLTAMRSFQKIRHHMCNGMPDSNYITNN
jgi:hypothetical protein